MSDLRLTGGVTLHPDASMSLTTVDGLTYTLAVAAPYSNPMTTLGDMIRGGAAGAETRLPGNTTTIPMFLKSTGTGSAANAPAWAQADFADLSGVASVAQIPNLPASQIASGQLALARGGTASDLSSTGGASMVLKQLALGAAITVSVLGFSDLSGSVAAAQMPALTGDVVSTAGTVATTVQKINGVSMAGLATGILKNTTTTGQPSIAVAADFPTLNQNTTGNAATATTASNALAVDGVTVSGTPSVGQVLTATSGTAANWQTPATGGGSVTSVGLALPSIFTVSGSPVTTSGTLTGTLATQSANLFFAGPSSGAAAAPTFRAIAAADMPALTGDVMMPAGSTTTTLATTQPGAHTWSATQTMSVAASINGITVGGLNQAGISTDPTYGFMFRPATGTTYDFALVNAANSDFVLTVATGTKDGAFHGNLSVGSTLAVSGQYATISRATPSSQDQYLALAGGLAVDFRIGRSANSDTLFFATWNGATQTIQATINAASVFSVGQVLANATESLRTTNDNGFISFYNTANTTRSGYLQITTSSANLGTDLAIPIDFIVNGGIKASLSPVGVFSLSANIASSASTNGTLVVTGGAGISGDIFAGASLNGAGSLVITAPTGAQVVRARATGNVTDNIPIISAFRDGQIEVFMAAMVGGYLKLGAFGGTGYTDAAINGVTGFTLNSAGAGVFASSVTATQFVGPVTAIKSATTSVDVSAATAPSAGQVLTATSSTAATWQTPGASANQFNRIANGSFYQGLEPWQTSGTTVPVFSTTTATSGTSGSASMAATGGIAHVTTTGSVSQAFSIPAPIGTLTLTYKTACYYSAASFNSNTGSVKVYIYNASTGTETLVATNSLTATGTTPSWTNRSVTVTSNITGAGEWGVRFEMMADTDNTGGTGTKTTTTLLDDVVLVI